MEYSTLQQAETHSLPMLVPGAVRHWPAFVRWREQSGVLRMTALAGKAQVQVMNSTEKEPLFFGDMRQYTPHTCSFDNYLSACYQSSHSNTDESLSAARGLSQAYLAQATLDRGQPLAALRQDFDIPEAIKHVEVLHTNLWMSLRGSRSSLHYDPYHNLLCLVQGKKTVKLMSPEVTQQLYPMSILGESPNHSHVNFARPDLTRHPLYPKALAAQQEFTLQAGDALFIPEGWWHQVDSDHTTIAVNFWWQSTFTKGLQQQAHMQQYYLRRLMDGLLDTERSNALSSVQPHPAIQALQAAVDVVVSSHQESDDMTTSDSFGTSSSSTGPSSSAATEAGPAVAAAPAEQVAQSVPAAAAVSQVDHDSHHDPGQSDSSPNVPAANVQLRQSGATLLGSLESCRPGRKRKAADMHHECRSGHPAAKQRATSQVTQPPRQQIVPEAEGVQAACHSGQHAAQQQSQDNSSISPSADGRAAAAAAGSSLQHHADTSRAEANCAGSQDPLHMACMQLLAGAVADGLHKTGAQDASMGLEDPISCILAALHPEDLRPVLAMMSRRVPRTLEALLLHALPPAAAELLTQKLEQADASAAETGSRDGEQFYSDLYSVTPDPQKALHALLDRKEAFSQQLCQGLMSRLFGVQCTFPAASAQ